MSQAMPPSCSVLCFVVLSLMQLYEMLLTRLTGFSVLFIRANIMNIDIYIHTSFVSIMRSNVFRQDRVSLSRRHRNHKEADAQ